MRFYEINISGAPRRWIKEEDQYLIENYGFVTLDYITKKLGRSKGVVTTRAKFLRNSGEKLPKKSLRPSKFKGQKPTKEELEKLLKIFSSYQISKKIGVSDASVRYWIKAYGIETDSEDAKRVV
ncbi:hypothetical protein BES34_014170 [Leptospira inadai serovar Lyme]|uniref:Homeodomain-like domain protein n=1 Tax=Leptospira inadai serovar Lyme TaxID=293084 RepID=A0ABX4YGE3_9LEPT|nr:hypothetical protein BES34_014170 [Leptospira inadai serovar Lyme]